METQSATGVRTAPKGEWDDAWAAALEALELDVLEAERLLTSAHPNSDAELVPAAHAAWTPPVLPGPLPSNLVARAEAILARQLRVAEDLARAMGSNHREQQVARKMNSGSQERATSVFVDSQF